MSDTLLPDLVTPIPTPLTSFLGRDQEIATVTALLGTPGVRLLTFTGPGGIGKTRLVLQVAANVSTAFPDGTTVVSLAAIRDADLVAASIAQTLGVPDAPDQPVSTRLRIHLRDKRLLLVLDNLEHLLEAAVPLVASLLAHCLHLIVLGTSRTRLGVSGEQVFPLDVLSAEVARSLFVVRAQSHAPAFVLTSDLIPVVDAICDRLDRLPLAIELAAARITMLPPRALLARLEHALDLLTGGPRDSPARHRDMRGAIAWSYDLLTAEDRVLFRRLGVFAGGFMLEAAQAVSGDADVFEAVSALVAASLVTPMENAGDVPRFTMLETIREYALEQLAASAEESDIRKAHAHYVLTLGEKLWTLPEGPMTDAWMRRLQSEIGNIRVALSWTFAHEPDTASNWPVRWVTTGFIMAPTAKGGTGSSAPWK